MIEYQFLVPLLHGYTLKKLLRCQFLYHLLYVRDANMLQKGEFSHATRNYKSLVKMLEHIGVYCSTCQHSFEVNNVTFEDVYETRMNDDVFIYL